MYSLENISMKYGSLDVIKDMSIHIETNEIISILGPSGCGKTTLLNMITGLINEYEGKIQGFEEKKISYLFQDLRLLPWKNVFDNMVFVLKGKVKDDYLSEHIDNFLKYVGLQDYKEFAIHELSGGMQQRLSLARAFAYPSQILLMDEPFKSLDYEMRHHIIETFKNLWNKEKKTVIFITHDIRSAIQLSDTIYLLSDKPTQILKRYKNPLSLHQRTFEEEDFIALEKQLYIDFIK
ncbi:ABC transporter ATP-binding protein [Vallitalea okinawensis]|uniref:ABC transporter ATP-binding protein n=1 Tax=Vallitalea okinawensis TaxID=2078660 RepID=UPI000CFD91E1|nr:ABC transporter ATP-binding protein [Vallitalea okinawensis]